MTPNELEELYAPYRDRDSLPNVTGGDRTLLYGLDVLSRLHHVYLQDGEVHRVVYHGGSGAPEVFLHQIGDEISIMGIVPELGLYPEACDFEFCRGLKERGVSFIFREFGQIAPLSGPFRGHVVEDAPSLTP